MNRHYLRMLFARDSKSILAPKAALPRTPRELLLALGGMPPQFGLDDFLDRFNYSGVTPHHIYHAALARMPESARVAISSPGYDARQHLREVLLSIEFQANIITRVVEAFPEKQRLLFVHVPKCAGSDFAAHLMRNYPYLGQVHQDPAVIPANELLPHLRTVVTDLVGSNTIALAGHIGLGWMLSARLPRYGDTISSVLRDPIDMAISKVNFVLTLLTTQQDPLPAYIRVWMDKLALWQVPRVLSEDEGRNFALRFLRDRTIVPENNICQFLGRGNYESALDLCASADIELTTMAHYARWLKERWGIQSDTRANESRKFLHRDQLSVDDLAHIESFTHEDRRFYNHVENRLAATGRTSILGTRL